MKINLYICIYCNSIRIIAFEKSDKYVDIVFNLYLPLNIKEDISISEKNLAKKIIKYLNDYLNKNQKIKIKKIFFVIDDQTVKNTEINIIGLKKDKDIKSVVRMKLQQNMDINLEESTFFYSKKKQEDNFKIYVWIIYNQYIELFKEIAKNLKVFKYKIFCQNEILKKIIEKEVFTINNEKDLLLALCYESETKLCVISEKKIQSIVYIKDSEYIDKSVKTYFEQIENKFFFGENKKNIEKKLGITTNISLLKNKTIIENKMIKNIYLDFMLSYENEFIDFNFNKNIVAINICVDIFGFLVFIFIVFLCITTSIENKQTEELILKENKKLQTLQGKNDLESNNEKGYNLKGTYSQNLKDIYNNIKNENIEILEISNDYIKLDFTVDNFDNINKLKQTALLENTYIQSIEKVNVTEKEIYKDDEKEKKNKKEKTKNNLEIKFISINKIKN